MAEQEDCKNCGNPSPMPIECALNCGEDLCDICSVRLKIQQPGPGGKQEVVYIHPEEWEKAEKYIMKE